jgi:hypothetical protein
MGAGLSLETIAWLEAANTVLQVTWLWPPPGGTFFFPVLGFELRAYTLSTPPALFLC